MEDTWHSLEKMRESSRKVGALGYCLGGKLCDLNAVPQNRLRVGRTDNNRKPTARRRRRRISSSAG